MGITQETLFVSTKNKGYNFTRDETLYCKWDNSLPFFSNDIKTAVQVDMNSDKTKACFYLEQHRNSIPKSQVKQMLAIFTLKLMKKLGIAIPNTYPFK